MLFIYNGLDSIFSDLFIVILEILLFWIRPHLSDNLVAFLLNLSIVKLLIDLVVVEVFVNWSVKAIVMLVLLLHPLYFTFTLRIHFNQWWPLF